MFSYLYGPLFEDLANQNWGFVLAPRSGGQISPHHHFLIGDPQSEGAILDPSFCSKIAKTIIDVDKRVGTQN